MVFETAPRASAAGGGHKGRARGAPGGRPAWRRTGANSSPRGVTWGRDGGVGQRRRSQDRWIWRVSVASSLLVGE